MYEIDIKGLPELFAKLNAAVKDDVIRKGLSASTLRLAAWSSANRIAPLNPNRKNVLPDKLTARSSYGYKNAIFGQSPSEVSHSGNEYTAKFGTNIKSAKGFSYPRLHEFGGKFHPARPVLSPALADKSNQQMVLEELRKRIQAELDKQ